MGRGKKGGETQERMRRNYPSYSVLTKNLNIFTNESMIRGNANHLSFPSLCRKGDLLLVRRKRSSF